MEYKINRKDISDNDLVLLLNSCNSAKKRQSLVLNTTLSIMGFILFAAALNSFIDGQTSTGIFTIISSSILLFIMSRICKPKTKTIVNSYKNIAVYSKQSIELRNGTYYYKNKINELELTTDTVKEIIISKNTSLLWLKKAMIIIPNNLFGSDELFDNFINSVSRQTSVKRV